MLDMELYGGKSGYFENLRARAMYACGAYKSAHHINWEGVLRLVFVCKGNICRSPYASGRARLMGIPAISLGLNSSDGSSADPAASRNALVRGIDLSAHCTTRFESFRIVKGDLVVSFEPRHLAEIRRRVPKHGVFVTLLGLWAAPACPHIQDPYGRSDRYFQRCLSVIDTNIAALVHHMTMGNTRAFANGIRAMRDAEGHSSSAGGTNS